MEPSELDSVDLLLQLSEESGELIQAVSKMARKERGANPTPVSAEACRDAVVEEMADVRLVLEALAGHWAIDADAIDRVAREKRRRWRERLSR